MTPPHSPTWLRRSSWEVDENTPSGRDVDNAVSASDSVTTNLTYTLEGRDAALFAINSGDGQIKTKSRLNHEDPACGYVGYRLTQLHARTA